MALQEQVARLADSFAACKDMLSAIGDETRQHLIVEMLRLGDCNGVRVWQIAARTNLSRPAVSHHLRILKGAGIVKVRKEGTKNYYYFDPDPRDFTRLVSTLELAMELSREMPDRSNPEETTIWKCWNS